jgi:hypothetical protein
MDHKGLLFETFPDGRVTWKEAKLKTSILTAELIVIAAGLYPLTRAFHHQDLWWHEPY